MKWCSSVFTRILWLCLLSTFGLVPQGMAARLPQLKVIYLVDTNAGTVGADVTPGCVEGRKTFEKILAETFEGKEERYKFRAIGEYYLNRENLYEYLRENAVDDPSDTVWFHYCGHGATDPETGHYFATSADDIDRSDLKDVLVGTGARLVVMTSDACSSPGAFQFLPPRRSPASWEVFSQLFFEHSGVTDITAATAPELAWINFRRGGFFGQALGDLYCSEVSSVDSNGDGFVTWEEGYTFIKSRTQEIFSDARDNAKTNFPDSEITKVYNQTPAQFGLAARSDGSIPIQNGMKIRLVNSTDSTLKLSGSFYMPNEAGQAWNWTPAGGQKWGYELAPGASKYLNSASGGPLVAAAVSFTASAGNSTFGPHTVTTGSKGYSSRAPKTYDLVLRENPSIDGVTVNTTHHVFRKGRKGMLIQLGFTAHRLLRTKALANALFYMSDGKTLVDFDGAFATDGGQVGVASEFVPIYNHSKFELGEVEGVELFMPYDQLHLKEGKHSLYFKIHVSIEGKTIFQGTNLNQFTIGE